MGKRMEQVDASIARYLAALDRADREEGEVAEVKSGRLKEKVAGLRWQMQALKVMEQMVQDAGSEAAKLLNQVCDRFCNEMTRIIQYDG